MTDRIAFFTLGVLKEHVGHPQVQGFVERGRWLMMDKPNALWE